MFLVDTACVAPARGTGGIHDRAFRFRSAAQAAWQERLDLDWPVTALEAPEAQAEDLPPESVGLQSIDLRKLVGGWDIDHTVGPVPDLPGGAAAAEARWKTFQAEGLSRYHRRRNDATIEDGVSGLSPYLHHGMISPIRVAREASRNGGEGAAKFLDELLFWRELSHHFCLHHPRHDSLKALPEWVRQTLDQHRHDPRPERQSWKTLARGRTDDRLWDLAQASLRIHGRLHNNLRMTRGKMLLEWTASPEEALDRLFDLNDRDALDGSDANSIGGLLWCMGLFDRGFEPERPVTGTLRSRSTREQARRLNTDRFETLVTPGIQRESVLVIGAGIAGSYAARILRDHGHPVTALDKSRGPGGRSSSRWREGVRHDHGCQVFRLRGARLERLARSWEEDGVIERWYPRILHVGAVLPRPRKPWFVGVPGMNEVVRHLQSDLAVNFNAPVARLERTTAGWGALDDGAVLLGEGAREASRPRRVESGAWTINATPDWSHANLELEAGAAESQLRALVGEAVGTTLASPGKAHRW